MKTANHGFQREELMAFLDGELSTERAAALSEHLKQCEECSHAVSEFKSVSQELTAWRILTIPDHVEKRVATARLASAGALESSGTLTSPRFSNLRFGLGTITAIAVLLLLLAIGTPNLLKSRMAANESSAVGSLRLLNTAAVNYRSTYGHYPLSLRNFGSPAKGAPSEEAADLIDSTLAAGQRSGYVFTYLRISLLGGAGQEGYKIKADPLNPGSTGMRHFSTDQTGEIRAEPGGIIIGSSREVNQNDAGRTPQERQFARIHFARCYRSLVPNRCEEIQWCCLRGPVP